VSEEPIEHTKRRAQGGRAFCYGLRAMQCEKGPGRRPVDRSAVGNSFIYCYLDRIGPNGLALCSSWDSTKLDHAADEGSKNTNQTVS
jgi:hypothetical protein